MTDARAGTAAAGLAHGSPAGSDAGDADAVQDIMRRGGSRLQARMTQIEIHLERVTARAGEPLASHATGTVLAGGKRLRPLLVVLAAESAGGTQAEGGLDGGGDDDGSSGGGAKTQDGEEEALVRAAVAVELVHSATLVHDDVIDGAQLRRGRPSVAAAAGRRLAIATGDLLFSRAFAELARNEDDAQLRALSGASSALAEGELLQREDAYATHVPVDRYLHRCELKTAALFEAACRLGALVAAAGGADRSLAEELGAFARRIGLAFQLLDDVLDVSGPVERTGKARGTDLLDGTVTLPFILARESDPELAQFDLCTLNGPDEAERLCERIAATGALQEARERALDLVAQAKAALPRDRLNGRAALLDLVADAVVERYR
jgi:geranylgeranyl pyrophosphate synthase